MKQENEAIRLFKRNIECLEGVSKSGVSQDLIVMYQSAIDALKKQEAMAPISHKSALGYKYHTCPNCGAYAYASDNYCCGDRNADIHGCGQRLDWEESK